MINNKTELENLKGSMASFLENLDTATTYLFCSSELTPLGKILRNREVKIENIISHISLLESQICSADEVTIRRLEVGLKKRKEKYLQSASPKKDALKQIQRLESELKVEQHKLDNKSVKEFAKIIHDAVILLADVLFLLIKAKQNLNSTEFLTRLKLQQYINSLYSNKLLADQLRCQISNLWLMDFEKSLMQKLEELKENEEKALYKPNYLIATTLYNQLKSENIRQNVEKQAKVTYEAQANVSYVALPESQKYENLNGRLIANPINNGAFLRQQELQEFKNFNEHPTVVEFVDQLNKAQKDIKEKASWWQLYVSGYALKLESYFKNKKRELNRYAILLSNDTAATAGNGIISNEMQKKKLISQLNKLKNKIQNKWPQRAAIRDAKKELIEWLAEFESSLNNSTTFKLDRFVDFYKVLNAIKQTLEELDATKKPFIKYTHTNFYKEVVNAMGRIEKNADDKPALAKSLAEANGVFNRGKEILTPYNLKLLEVLCAENEKKILYYANQSTTAVSDALVATANPLNVDALQKCINQFQVETCKTNGFMRWVGKRDLRYAQIYMDLIEKTTEGELSRRIILFALLTNEKLGNRFKNHLAKHIAELQNYNISDNLVESVIKQLATSIKSAVCPDKNSEDHENHLKTVNTVVKELCRLSGRQATVEGNTVYQWLLEMLNELSELNQPENKQQDNQVEIAMERANSQRELRRQSSNLSSTDSTDMLANPTTEEISLATNETATDTERNSGRHSSSFELFTSNEQQISPEEREIKDKNQEFKNIIINYKKNLCNKGAFLGLINSQNFLRAQAYSELLEGSTFELATMSIVYAALSSKQAGDFKYPLAIKAVTTYELKAVNGLASTIEALKKKIDEQFDPVKTHYPENYLYTMVIAQITDAADKGYTLDDGFYVDALGKLELIKTSLANAKQERPTATQHRMEAPIINIVGPYGNS